MPRKVRPIRICGDVAYVPLTKGYEAVIDAADVPLIDARNWSAHVVRHKDGSIRTVYAVSGLGAMHRVLLPGAEEVDHRDGNGLDCRRSANLRAASVVKNRQNRRYRGLNVARFKGVTWHAATGQWRAKIRAEGKYHHLGLFNCAAAAAVAYAKASAYLHGDFGRVA